MYISYILCIYLISYIYIYLISYIYIYEYIYTRSFKIKQFYYTYPNVPYNQI